MNNSSQKTVEDNSAVFGEAIANAKNEYKVLLQKIEDKKKELQILEKKESSILTRETEVEKREKQIELDLDFIRKNKSF